MEARTADTRRLLVVETVSMLGLGVPRRLVLRRMVVLTGSRVLWHDFVLGAPRNMDCIDEGQKWAVQAIKYRVGSLLLDD